MSEYRWRPMSELPPEGAMIDLYAEGPGKDAPLERYVISAVWRFGTRYGSGFRKVERSKPLAWRYVYPGPSIEEQQTLGIAMIDAPGKEPTI